MASFSEDERATKRKPVIAVLHGTAANASIVKFQLGALVPRLASQFELVFVDGPLRVADTNRHAVMMRRVFGAHQDLREYGRAGLDDRGWRTYDAVDEALVATAKAVTAAVAGRRGAEQTSCYHPDAILAFSQGANFATMLAAMAEHSDGAPPMLKAVVLFCGARPGWTRQLPDLFSERDKLRTPALVVAAEPDPVVHDGPRAMAALFDDATLLTHAEGHKPLPSADRAACEALVRAVTDFLVARCCCGHCSQTTSSGDGGGDESASPVS